MAGKENFLTGDRIIIDRLETLCKLGITAQERSQPQPVILTLEIETDLLKAGHTDRLEHTVDYAQIVKGIESLLSSQPFVLIESVAEKVAEWILLHFPVHLVDIQAMKKPFPNVAAVGVRIRRTAKRTNNKKNAKKTK